MSILPLGMGDGQTYTSEEEESMLHEAINHIFDMTISLAKLTLTKAQYDKWADDQDLHAYQQRRAK